MTTTETGTGMTAGGGATINPYEDIGPTIQTYGYGWGTGNWSRLSWGVRYNEFKYYPRPRFMVFR